MRVSFSCWKCLYQGSIIGLAPTERGLKRVPAKVGEPQATAVGTKSGGLVPRGFMCNTLQHAGLVPERSFPMLLKGGGIEVRRLHNDGRKNAYSRLM